jgi:hypothetical protein
LTNAEPVWSRNLDKNPLISAGNLYNIVRDSRGVEAVKKTALGLSLIFALLFSATIGVVKKAGVKYE